MPEDDYLGIDEKQFRAGHNYVSSLYDLTGKRLLDAVEGRTENVCKRLIEWALAPGQQCPVTAGSLDIWQADTTVPVPSQVVLPQVDICG